VATPHGGASATAEGGEARRIAGETDNVSFSGLSANLGQIAPIPASLRMPQAADGVDHEGTE
jgi:hypothetical protein